MSKVFCKDCKHYSHNIWRDEGKPEHACWNGTKLNYVTGEPVFHNCNCELLNINGDYEDFEPKGEDDD